MGFLGWLILWLIAGLINVIIYICSCMIENESYYSFLRELSEDFENVIICLISGLIGLPIIAIAAFSIYIGVNFLEKIYNCKFISNLRERWNK